MADFLFYGCFSTQTLSIYDFSRWQIIFAHSVQHVCAACIYVQQLLFLLATSLSVQASNLPSVNSTDSPNALLFFSEVLLSVNIQQRKLPTEFALTIYSCYTQHQI